MSREWRNHYWGNGERCPVCGGKLKGLYAFPGFTLARRDPTGVWVCVECPFPFRLEKHEFEEWKANHG